MLELGPSAVSNRGWPSLGEALEAGYAAARQAVRASNGIRVLLMLLQVWPAYELYWHSAASSMPGVLLPCRMDSV